MKSIPAKNVINILDNNENENQLESIIPNFDFFGLQIFVVKLECFLAQENIVCTLKWPRLIAKKRKKSSFYEKKTFGGIDYCFAM